MVSTIDGKRCGVDWWVWTRWACPLMLALVVGAAAAQGYASAPAGPTRDAAPHAAHRDDAANGERTSPRRAMLYFLAAANDAIVGKPGGLDRVRPTLDLSTLDDIDDARLLELTEKLKGVIDRLGQVRSTDLPDTALVRAEGISRYVFFPRGEQHQWVWERLGAAPDGSIVLSRTDEHGWRIDAATIAGIDALYESVKALPPIYSPDMPHGAMAAIVGPTFANTSWWQWLTLFGAIFLGLAAGKILQLNAKRLEARAAERGWVARALLLQDAASPISLACLTTGLFVGMQFVHLEDDMRQIVGRMLQFLYMVAAGWFAYNLVNLIDVPLRIVAKGNATFEKMILPLVRRSLRIFLVIIFGIFILQNIFELNITGFLAGLGIAGLALSLAAQDSVKNLFGSLTVFLDRPFQVGNFINFDGVIGSVEEIGFRSTRIRQPNGHLVTIPNMRFIDTRVENIAARQYIHQELNLTITYDTPPDKVEQAVQILKDILMAPDIVEEGQWDMEGFPPRVMFLDYNADSLGIKTLFRYQLRNNPDRNMWTFRAMLEKINLRILRAFNEAGIDFAFPTQTLHLAGDSKRELAVRVHQAPPPSAGDPPSVDGDASASEPRA